MINRDLLKIEKENAFSKLAKIVKEYKEKYPEKTLVSLGIGDVSKPIVKPVIEAMHKAVDDLSSMDNFQGYGAYYGLTKLKEAIIENEYKDYGFTNDEIFVSDGTKSDSSNILELFDNKSKVLVGNPVYPIYENGAFALNRKVYKINCDRHFKMPIPKKKYDIIYICSPTNPTGVAYTYDDLKKWVDYALNNGSVIIFDNVYRVFVESKDVPKTIYEIDGSKKCCIEMRSYSKSASFTGMRCSYFVLPKELGLEYMDAWKERTINRFNGANYVAQMGAIASYSKEAQELIKENIRLYKENALYLRKSLKKLGFKVYGGVDAPYLWIKCKNNEDSWDFFKRMLNDTNVIIIPGSIFGTRGKNYFRVSALGLIENSKKAIERMTNYYEKEI